MTSDDEGEGVGGEVTIPPKNDDVIYEQPLLGRWGYREMFLNF